MTDLVERVARAIRCGQRFTTKAAARAAIAVVVEEAAKVADSLSDPPSNDQRHPDWQMGWQDGAMECAAAIRALNPKERP